MKGFVSTPASIVDGMVAKLFSARQPQAEDRLLDPGCGTGVFIQGVIRWCRRNGCPVPRITGIESDPSLLEEARRSVGHIGEVCLLNEDFLTPRLDRYDYVIGNPPYVPITGLALDERAKYRQQYLTARGRFDLYLLFFEQALQLLQPGARLVFITPEKFLYVQTAEPLRRQLAQLNVEEIELIDESTFGDLVTYPTITTVSVDSPSDFTRIRQRDGSVRTVRLSASGSWLPLLNGARGGESGPRLLDAFLRISCGVATGADAIYVLRNTDVPHSLQPFAFPTISGRAIRAGSAIKTTDSMLIPYSRNGQLLSEAELGPLGEYLREPRRRARLLQRTCTLRKQWYAFHENPPLDEILRPKILCKDIGARPWFVADESGDVVPRHSVYYLVPSDPSRIDELCAYLNSDASLKWLMAHCQRAANGFIRLQSHVLKTMPLPDYLVRAPQLACV